MFLKLIKREKNVRNGGKMEENIGEKIGKILEKWKKRGKCENYGKVEITTNKSLRILPV